MHDEIGDLQIYNDLIDIKILVIKIGADLLQDVV